MGPSDLEDVFKEATWRVYIRGKALSFWIKLENIEYICVYEVTKEYLRRISEGS